MRFPLIHTGRRFFFFTFVVEGRWKVLSRLERGAKRPALTALGERVKAVWAALHRIDAHFTASDFVIMPDHVHLLLIVNSDGEFRFNPLVFAHWFMAATSDGGRCPPIPPVDGSAGFSPLIPPVDWWHFFPATQGIGGGEQNGPAPQGIGGGEQNGPATQGIGGGQPPSLVWSPDFWVEISLDARQLAAIRRYIRMNPARYFWKLDNPDMFLRHARFRHPILDPALTWTACGDLTLLASPFLFLVRLTMKKTAAELEGEIAGHIERVKRGGIPVSGFLSAGEREFERRLKALPHSRWIKTVPYSLPARYDPSVEDSRYLAAHRELILSSFTEQEAPPFVIRRRLCLAMNERTAAMVTNDGGRCPPIPPVDGSAGSRPPIPPAEIHPGGSLSLIKESPDGTDH